MFIFQMLLLRLVSSILNIIYMTLWSISSFIWPKKTSNIPPIKNPLLTLSAATLARKIRHHEVNMFVSYLLLKCTWDSILSSYIICGDVIIYFDTAIRLEEFSYFNYAYKVIWIQKVKLKKIYEGYYRQKTYKYT